MIGTLGLSALSVFNFIRGDLILFNLIRPSLEPLAMFFLTYWFLKESEGLGMLLKLLISGFFWSDFSFLDWNNELALIEWVRTGIYRFFLLVLLLLLHFLLILFLKNNFDSSSLFFLVLAFDSKLFELFIASAFFWLEAKIYSMLISTLSFWLEISIRFCYFFRL